MNSPIRLSRFARGDSRRIEVSFEFFPPNTEEMDKILWESIERLAPLAPNFVSVTYGAGGTTRERTHSTVKRILAETPLTPAAHLTCVAATHADIDQIVRTQPVRPKAADGQHRPSRRMSRSRRCSPRWRSRCWRC